MTAAQISALKAVARAHRRELLALENGLTPKTSKLVNDLYARIVEAIRTAPGAASNMTQAQLMSQVRGFVHQAKIEASTMMENYSPKIINVSIKTSMDTLEVFGLVSPKIEEAARVYAHFQSIKDTGELLSRWGGRDKYVTAWQDALGESMGPMVRSLQSSFTRSTLSGLDWREVAANLTDKLGKLNINSAVDPEVFAAAFARTKVNELMNEVSQQIGTEAGFELYVDLGVGDDVQSEECYTATNMGALTLAEWDASDVGPPPRHFANCRDVLVAVPFDPELKWSNPKYDKKEVAA